MATEKETLQQVQSVDNKRYAFIPLSYDNADRALAGEIVADDKTGNVWVRNRETGELVCATQNVGLAVEDAIDARMGNLDYAFHSNRTVYRFYFDGNAIKLDSSINLPSEYCYYQVRDVYRSTKYYTNKLTAINKVATSIYPEAEEAIDGSRQDALVNNGTYFVEFYNINFELLTQILFTAKKAPALYVENNELDKIVDHIEIATNRKVLYIGEPVKALNTRVYAVFADGTQKLSNDLSNVSLKAIAGNVQDITDRSLTFIDVDDIDTTKPGTYTIYATFINKADNYTTYEAMDTIEVSETEYQRLLTNGLVIVPKVYGVNEDIRLTAFGYFTDGTKRNITENVSFGDTTKLKFDENGVLDKEITVTFNLGETTQQQRTAHILLYTNNGAANQNIQNAVWFNNDMVDGLSAGRNILALNPNYVAPETYAYYRVCSVNGGFNEDDYYTTTYGTAGYATSYIEVGSNILADGDSVLVEFYSSLRDEQGNPVLIAADVLTAKYKEASAISNI